MKKSFRLIKRRTDTRHERGQALVEFALVSLAFFMLIFGIIDGTRLYESWITLQHAAREGARFAITGQVACDGYTDDRDACIVQTATDATEGITGGGHGSTVVDVNLVYWAYPDYADPPQTGSGAQCDAIEVRVTYTHKFSFPVLQAIAPGGITMTGSQRMVNEPFGPCGAEGTYSESGGSSPPAGPIDTPTPGATPTNTAVPTATNTAVPTATSTPVPPTATNTPVPPTATSMPGSCSYWWCAPTPTPTPSCSYWWCH